MCAAKRDGANDQNRIYTLRLRIIIIIIIIIILCVDVDVFGTVHFGGDFINQSSLPNDETAATSDDRAAIVRV